VKPHLYAKGTPLGELSSASETEGFCFRGEAMSQKNMGRLAQDMKREVIAIIGRLKDPRLEGGLLTVTRLDVTPDLDVAKVYVSVMGREDGPKPAIEALNRAAGHVRTEVSKKMHIRKAPRFIFVEDDGAAYAAHINELLRTLNVNGDAEETSQPEETEE
jgi:ribosome-binding factor A